MELFKTCIWCRRRLPLESFGTLRNVQSAVCAECASWHHWAWTEFECTERRSRFIEATMAWETFDKPVEVLLEHERVVLREVVYRHLADLTGFPNTEDYVKCWYGRMRVGQHDGWVVEYGCPAAPHKRSIESVMYELDELRIMFHQPGKVRPAPLHHQCQICGYYYPIERFIYFRFKGRKVCSACTHFPRGKQLQAARLRLAREQELEEIDRLQIVDKM